MLKIDKPIVVEGKYDKIKLENIIDGLIIPTDGFGIFKNNELLNMLRSLAEKKGLIILTDSDSAGFMIRSFLSGCIDNSKITHVYIPEIFGKEKRKVKAGAEGILGVEGIDDDLIVNAFKRAGISADVTKEPSEKITKSDLYELGFSGKEDSSVKRKELLRSLGLPSRISSNRLSDVLNMLMTYDELINHIKELNL